MSEWIMYHNPRCSKSKETLQILKDHGVDPMIIEYLKLPPGPKMLRHLASKLGVEIKDMVREKEPAFKELELDLNDEEGLVAGIAEEPSLLQRPIVLRGVKAVFGRPPETVKQLFKEEDLERAKEIAAAKATPAQDSESSQEEKTEPEQSES